MNLPTSPAIASSNPFYATPQQRIALARRRFFEEGVRPSGMVSEAVIQSWSRCLRAHREPHREAVFEPVTPSRVHSTLRAGRELLEAAGSEMSRLQAALAGTTGTAMLTDALGVIIGSTYVGGHAHERIMPVSTRIGVNLAEECVGTTAPGITARTGAPSVVLGAEHFFGNVTTMHCAAAPIRDVHGRVAGVLDISSEAIPFAFDAASVVGLYATAIENRLLCAQSTDHLIVCLQLGPALLDTPMAGLVGVAADGCVAWLNGAATRLLGLPARPDGGTRPTAEQVFGLPLGALATIALGQEPQPLRLPNGLTLWVRCEMRVRDGAQRVHALGAVAEREAAPPRTEAPAPATLRESERELVVRTVEACSGNVSRAARQLGVSRGLIYRHLRAAGR